jgi:hypothetical protein
VVLALASAGGAPENGLCVGYPLGYSPDLGGELRRCRRGGSHRRPASVVEIQIFDFIALTMDQVVNQAAPADAKGLLHEP